MKISSRKKRETVSTARRFDGAASKQWVDTYNQNAWAKLASLFMPDAVMMLPPALIFWKPAPFQRLTIMASWVLWVEVLLFVSADTFARPPASSI